MVTMVWVVSRFGLKAPPGISSSCISPLTSSGQRSRASWASQPQKSATLSLQPGGKPRKFVRTCGGAGGDFDIIKMHGTNVKIYLSNFRKTAYPYAHNPHSPKQLSRWSHFRLSTLQTSHTHPFLHQFYIL